MTSLSPQRTRPLPTTCALSCGEALFVVNEPITEMVVGVSDDTRLIEKKITCVRDTENNTAIT